MLLWSFFPTGIQYLPDANFYGVRAHYLKDYQDEYPKYTKYLYRKNDPYMKIDTLRIEADKDYTVHTSLF